VEPRYDYPRFLCYDCHAYVPYAYWNPYAHFCSRYSLFVYYDPFYFYPSYWYPTRYYGGTAVVYVRPRFAGSQYVFKAPGDQSVASIQYRDRRTTGMQSVPADRGVRGLDLGGVGSVPAPTGGGRRMAGGGGVLQSPGGVPMERQPGTGGGGGKGGGGKGGGGDEVSGRRYATPTRDLGVIGPSRTPATKPSLEAAGGGRRYIGEPVQPAAAGVGQATPQPRTPKEFAPESPRSRGVYIEPGSRAEPRPSQQPAERMAPAAGAGRYAQPSPGPRPQAQPAQRGYAPPAAPRGGSQAQPRGESRPAPRSSGTPTLIRRRP
jgi:hypothetical protein